MSGMMVGYVWENDISLPHPPKKPLLKSQSQFLNFFPCTDLLKQNCFQDIWAVLDSTSVCFNFSGLIIPNKGLVNEPKGTVITWKTGKKMQILTLRSRLSQSQCLSEILTGPLRTVVFELRASFTPMLLRVWASYKLPQCHQKTCFRANPLAPPQPYSTAPRVGPSNRASHRTSKQSRCMLELESTAPPRRARTGLGEQGSSPKAGHSTWTESAKKILPSNSVQRLSTTVGQATNLTGPFTVATLLRSSQSCFVQIKFQLRWRHRQKHSYTTWTREDK